MIHLDLNKSNRFISIIICVAVIMVIFLCSSAPKEPQKCERCIELEKVIKHLTGVIKDHNDQYYFNTLCETDAWLYIDEILYEPTVDSLNKKVYVPDTLSIQAKPDTKSIW